MSTSVNVKIIRKDLSLVEVAGVRYKQVKLTIDERNKDACCGCCARLRERLCEHLAPFCCQGWVFSAV